VVVFRRRRWWYWCFFLHVVVFGSYVFPFLGSRVLPFLGSGVFVGVMVDVVNVLCAARVLIFGGECVGYEKR
jgi:hypothetical protein